MAERLSAIESEAVDWVIRSQAADFADWDGLSAWMARSPDHAGAFNALAALDDAVAGALRAQPAAASARAANDDGPDAAGPWLARPGFTRWSAMSLLLAVLLIGSLWIAFPRTVTIETAPGELREVRIDDGLTAWLNGDSRITYRRGETRAIELARGEALFDVRHGSGPLLEVEAGGIVMRDLGTRFNVVHSPSRTELAVAQGRVVFDARGQGITLGEGQGIRVSAGRAGVERFSLPAASVAGWRSGRLVYRDATIARIAEDLARRTGESVTIAPAARGLRFTGSIAAGASPRETVERAGAMLGLPARRGPSGWVLGSDAAAPR